VFWALVEEVGQGLATGRGSDWGTHRQHGVGSYDVHSPTHSVCNKKIVLAVTTHILPPDKLWFWQTTRIQFKYINP